MSRSSRPRARYGRCCAPVPLPRGIGRKPGACQKRKTSPEDGRSVLAAGRGTACARISAPGGRSPACA